MGWLNSSVAAVWGLGAGIGSLLSARRSNVTDIDALLLKHFGLESKSGNKVDVEAALKVTTVLAATRVLAEGIAQQPLKLYRLDEEKDTRRVERDHPAHDVMYVAPNEMQTSFGFRETMMFYAVLCGDAVAFQNRVRGRLMEVLPIPPGHVRIRRNSDWSMRYWISDPASGEWKEYGRSQILHLSGPSWNGFSGLDAVALARDAIGLAIATEENHARLHRNGSQVGGQITGASAVDGALMKRIRELFEARHQGLANSHKTVILGSGLEWKPIGMKGVDAEHLRTREHQIQEICRALNVFPQMIGFSDKTSTYASAEQFFIAHVVYSLGPWIRRWEETLNTQLLNRDDRRAGLGFRLNPTALLRGDARSRAEFYKSAILTGWMTRNEARRLEDWDPLDGLDEPLVPLNMAAAGAEQDEGAAAGTSPASSWPNTPIAPKGVVDALRALLLGHNGGPSLDD